MTSELTLFTTLPMNEKVFSHYRARPVSSDNSARSTLSTSVSGARGATVTHFPGDFPIRVDSSPQGRSQGRIWPLRAFHHDGYGDPHRRNRRGGKGRKAWEIIVARYPNTIGLCACGGFVVLLMEVASKL